MKRIALLLCASLLLQPMSPVAFADPQPPAQVPSQLNDNTDTGWPREISNNEQITIYEPQVEKWKDNRLEERAAVSVQTPASAEPTYGVIWLKARTEVDKTNHIVTLEDIRIERASFPSEPGKTGTYLSLLRKNTPGLIKQIALDRLQSNLEITQAESARPGKQAPSLRDTPPQIIYSKTPAVLVLIDGDPVLRDIGVQGFLRVVNTRALMIFDQSTGKYYFYMGDRWMESTGVAGLRGGWVQARRPPAALNGIKEAAVQEKTVDLLDRPGSPLMQELGNHVVPRVYVTTGPAELIQTQGSPKLQPIAGTSLLYVQNTSNDIFLNTSDQNYYVLLSGRWYHSRSLNGPWLFSSARKLPADFARIPETNRKGNVLASVAGTPQAQEAGIANEIPQTATVDRNAASLAVKYDGAPRFKPIAGTPLNYAINTTTPVIEVDPRSFYAVQNGIWFVATSPQGPWAAAASVPAVIYSIPPSSPMYYVTYVRVYGSTPEVVYDGYTPGYLGSYYCSDGVVVFGTGYWYTPWVGTFWVGPPLTFGFGWYWGVGFGWGLYAGAPFFPWWGPWLGWRGRVVVANVPVSRFNVNHFNVYRSWSHGVVRNTWERNAIATRSYTEQYGFGRAGRANNLYAGQNGHVYRYNSGNWEEHNPSGGWQHMNPGSAAGTAGIAGRAAGQTPGQTLGQQPGIRGMAPQERAMNPGVGELEQNRVARQRGDEQWNTFRGGGVGAGGRGGFARGGGRGDGGRR